MPAGGRALVGPARRGGAGSLRWGGLVAVGSARQCGAVVAGRLAAGGPPVAFVLVERFVGGTAVAGGGSLRGDGLGAFVPVALATPFPAP